MSAQTIWTGPTKTFVKTDSADWTLEVNQDRITDSVWLTRADKQSLFNIVTETKYTAFLSPANTEWAFGTTADIGTLTFENLQDANNGSPASMIDKDMVLHLISDDIYIDIKFTSFSGSNSGGGFSYMRSTNQMSHTDVLKLKSDPKMYPNPAGDFFEISGLSGVEEIKIYSSLGQILYEGKAADAERIDVRTFAEGVYFIRFENGRSLQLNKQ